ncbi:E3 ubiquitin-protein ligase MARCHF4 [Centroberyx gerrardi]
MGDTTAVFQTFGNAPCEIDRSKDARSKHLLFASAAAGSPIPAERRPPSARLRPATGIPPALGQHTQAGTLGWYKRSMPVNGLSPLHITSSSLVLLADYATYCTGALSKQGELLSPCRCSGSVRCSHEPCLIKWISERGAWSCELCYYKYHVISISTKNPLQWQSISLTVIEKVQIAAAVLGSLFLVASISWLVWSSLSPHARWQRQDLLFQICYAMYGFMDVVCIVLIVHEGPSVFRIFHRWQAVNQRWKVLNYDKARDLEEQQKPGSTPRGHPALTEADPRIRLPSGGQLGTERPSPSTSSLLAAVAAATSLPRVTAAGHAAAQHHGDEEDSGTSPTTMTTTSESEPSNNTGNSLSPVTEQNRSYRWTYSLLHLLGHRRPFMEQQNPEEQGLGPAPPRPRDSHRELVMRVTTV